MKKLIVTLAACAAIAAHAGTTSQANNPELVRMGKQAVAALSCAEWAAYLIPEKGKEAKYPQDAAYAKEATRLRTYGLKTGRAFIDRIKEVTNGDAHSHLPSLYTLGYLDYSQGTEFALGQLTKEVSENVTRQFKLKDTSNKYSYDREIWVKYASTAYSDGNCDLIGEKP
jgi:hypothetical protein